MGTTTKRKRGKSAKRAKRAKAPVSQAKAKKIMSDGEVRGKQLTSKQKGFFGRLAGGAKTVRVPRKKRK